MVNFHPCFNIRHNQDGRVVSSSRRPHFIPKQIPWYSFVLKPEWILGLLNTQKIIRGMYPATGQGGSKGSGTLRLQIFLTFSTMKVVRSSPLRIGRLYPQEFSWYPFLEAESTPGHKEKIRSDSIGDRTRDPPTSSPLP
jgi:hypothetical protein